MRPPGGPSSSPALVCGPNTAATPTCCTLDWAGPPDWCSWWWPSWLAGRESDLAAGDMVPELAAPDEQEAGEPLGPEVAPEVAPVLQVEVELLELELELEFELELEVEVGEWARM